MGRGVAASGAGCGRLGVASTVSSRSAATTARGISSSRNPTMRIGKLRMPNSATAWTSSPVEMSPVEMRHEPTATRATIPRLGRASSPGSNVARRRPTPRRAVRSPSAARRRRPTSRSSRPSDFTTRAPSNDSWATVATSPSRAWVVAAGTSTRRL